MRPPWILLSIVGLSLACGVRTERDEMTERTRGLEQNREIEAGIRAGAAEDMTIGYSTSEARFVRNLIGFQGPESVKYDAEQDVWFVSNMTGAGSVKDANGYISRISAAHPDSAVVFVESGQHGAVLDSPKGLAIHGDTLWVADISLLRGFDRHSGAPLATIDFTSRGAVQLNDVAIGPDGKLRVTDTGIMMTPKGVLHIGPDRVFVVGPGQQIGTMSDSATVTWPNGITWDGGRGRWIIVSFDPFDGRVYSVAPDGGEVKVLRQGSGRLDGVEVLADGSILFTSWADSSVHQLADGRDRTLVREMPEAADIGIDTRRNQLAIPLSVLGRVQIWDLGPIGRKRSH
jgi:sugar lactone lactonase YvrE